MKKSKIITMKWPFDKSYPVSSPYGIEREIKIDGVKTKRIHNGVDYAVPERTQCKALAPGKVIVVGYENPDEPEQGFGYRIIQETKIDGEIIYLWYTHLSWSYVHVGYPINDNDLVCMTGNTGRSSGPHIHFQARKKDTGDYYEIRFRDVPDV